MSWSRAFHVPIATPDGLMLRTLRDAGEYMQALPRAKLKQPEWEIAAETLLAAVEGSGPLMFAEIAMRKAVNAGKHVSLSDIDHAGGTFSFLLATPRPAQANN